MHANAPAQTTTQLGSRPWPWARQQRRAQRLPLPPALLALGLVLCVPVWATEPAPAARANAASKTTAKAPAQAHTQTQAADKPLAAGPQVSIAPVKAYSRSDDPIEHLRQRLSERLTTAKPSPSAVGPLEVRVLAKAPPAPAGGKGADGRGRHGGKAQNAQKVEKGHSAHWSYSGPAGPQTWGGLKPEFSLCANGQRQSPIDIQGGLPVDLEPVQFQYKASRFAVIDNGHTVQANLAVGNHIEVGGKRFDLKQFHFHRPSEERIDGRQFDMSLHLVHQDEQGRLAVVALLLDRGAPHGAVQKVWNNLPLEKNQEQPARVLLELNELLPSSSSYYTYMGSLTTPPCSEGVQWIVMRQPVSVSAEQIDLFSRLYPMNARPLQQLAGRRILQTP